MGPPLYHKYGGMAIFRPVNFVAQEISSFKKKILIFFHRRISKKCRLVHCRFRLFSMKKNTNISENAGFLGYKMNIDLPDRKLRYYRICDTKVCSC